MLRTVRLDPVTWKVPNEPVTFLYGAAAVQQYLVQRMLLWKGEYFLNRDRGMNYPDIMGARKEINSQEIIDYINASKYVKRVSAFSYSFSGRQLHIDFTAETDYGQVEVSV